MSNRLVEDLITYLESSSYIRLLEPSTMEKKSQNIPDALRINFKGSKRAFGIILKTKDFFPKFLLIAG